MKFLKSLLPVITAGLFAAGISIVFNSDVGRATFYKWSQTANTNATADATINWAEGMAPSAVNDSARAMMAATAKYRDDVSGKLVTTGTSTAYVLATNQVFTSTTLMDGAELAFKVNVTNGASSTLNVDGLGPRGLAAVSGTSIPAGALIAGSVYRATFFNSVPEWIVQGISGVLSAPSGTTIMVMSSSCPAGWTISLAASTDRAVRFNTSAGGGIGGATGFTSVFNAAGGGYALTLANLPSWTLGASINETGHTHANTFNDASHQHQPPNLVTATIASGAGATAATGAYTVGTSAGGLTSAASTGASITNASQTTGITASINGTGAAGGSGTAHNHVTPNLAWVDVIGCTKS